MIVIVIGAKRDVRRCKIGSEDYLMVETYYREDSAAFENGLG